MQDYPDSCLARRIGIPMTAASRMFIPARGFTLSLAPANRRNSDPDIDKGIDQ